MKRKIWYECDPARNVACRKRSCFRNGGSCEMTSRKEAAALGPDGKPVRVNLRERLVRKAEEPADLKELDRECWAWTVEPDSSFAAKAAFPIRLDPVVETERTTDAASMAYVTSVNPSVGYPATGYSTNIAHNH